MDAYDIDPGVAAAVANFKRPEQLGFGQISAPVMFDAEWREGDWQRGRLRPYGPIEVWPGSRALQYAELVFEGLKAYRVGRSRPNLFRAEANCRRMLRSAARLSMAVVPEPLFFQGIGAVVRACSDIMPTQSGRSLYLRPFLFGSESGYMLRNSRTFRFMVIANPVEPYSSGAMEVAIERADVRAAVGGIGEAKASANYAASLRASTAAVVAGRTIALWLDGAEHRYLQELSGMNIFAVLDGELHTPELDGAILPGITRDSLLTLARSLGYKTHERRIALDEVLEGIDSGRCSELFACGTAAIVSPVALLAEGDGREYRLHKTDVVAKHLRESLLAIQERRAPDPFGWTQELTFT
ncbi:MAG TPA: branched-chain amino acid aminotransferase [Steroidobacteraceae bacterium]|nr:branched-chain amino acid aminotransferase [Steroidobacteraceae bacterium]